MKKVKIVKEIIAKYYAERKYLSSSEAANYLGIDVKQLHSLVKSGVIKTKIATSGQMRFDIEDLKSYERMFCNKEIITKKHKKFYSLEINSTTQKIFVKNSMNMSELCNNSVHLMVTSPPYFDTKMYSKKPIENDLGDVHNIDEWFEKISKVWSEVFRVLHPGRKAFINIMNLPIKLENGSFKSLNLVGKTIDICEKIGFVFKRDIIWQKTNSVRAHFGTYPYPGGILINHTHEFILEFEKPEQNGFDKYSHLSKEQKEKSKLDKQFWIEIKKSDVWVMKPEGSGDKRLHVAAFPIELPFRIIRAFSYVGETVLDHFVGSGTTLLAAADLQRNGVGYEINPEIAEVAYKRMKKYHPKFI